MVASNQNFSDTGTYTFTVPDCVDTVTVECWGGGGGGFGGSTAPGRTGGGGGSGGCYVRATVAVVPGSDISVVVGSGGDEGQNGQRSSFDLGFSAQVIAAGGIGATSAGGAAPPSVGSCFGDIKRAGGAGGNGTQDGGGGAGSSAGTAADGADGEDGVTDAGGAGGTAPAGGGDGGSGGGPGGNGVGGNDLGGGGGGGGGDAATPGTGGHAGGGYVLVSWETAFGATGTLVNTMNGVYAPGSAILFTVTTNREIVYAAGGTAPSISFSLGVNTRSASLLSASGNTMTYRYIVTAADIGQVGVFSNATLVMNDSTLRDSCGNDIDTSIPTVSVGGTTFEYFSLAPSRYGEVRSGFNPQMMGD